MTIHCLTSIVSVMPLYLDGHVHVLLVLCIAPEFLLWPCQFLSIDGIDDYYNIFLLLTILFPANDM